MKATGDWVIVKYEEPAEVSFGGIYLPKKLDLSTIFAKVISVGPDVEQKDITEGDRVLVFRKPGIVHEDVVFTKPGNILAKEV